MIAKDKVYDALQYETGLGWLGGKTSFDLSEELGLHINTVRHALRELEKAHLIFACAPRVYHRLDGKTARTLIWYKKRHSEAF